MTNGPAPGLLTARGITFGFEAGVPILRDVDLVIRSGAIAGVVGVAGSGKSTLLALLASGLMAPDGSITLDGARRATRPGSFFPDVGYLMQFPERQFFEQTIEDEVGFAHIRSRGEAGAAAAVDEALRRVGLPGDTAFRARAPWQTSLGEQRLLALASVLVAGPRVLVLDEPTVALDRNGRARVRLILETFRDSSGGIVLASHDLGWAASLADDLYLVSEGMVAPIDLADPEDRARLIERGLPLPERWWLRAQAEVDFWDKRLYRELGMKQFGVEGTTTGSGQDQPAFVDGPPELNV